MKKAIIIIVIMRNIHANHNLFEIIPGKQQRFEFGVFFLLRVQLPGGLDIHAAISVIHHKINFTGNLFIAFSFCYLTDIHRISAFYELILHDPVPAQAHISTVRMNAKARLIKQNIMSFAIWLLALKPKL